MKKNRKNIKKNNKIYYLIPIVLIILLLVAVVYFSSIDTKKLYVKRFKHINTSEMYRENDKSEYKDLEYTYYSDKKGTPSKGGRKYAVRLSYPDKEIYIEENIIVVLDDEIQNIESVLYSKDEITQEIADDFIHSIHNETPTCGVKLNEFEKIEENYYYIKFDILGDC